MVQYRTFRNTDPPGIMDVWNQAIADMGGVRLQTSTPLEYHVFAKPYFDRDGFLVAENEGRIVGFGHAGFGPTADRSKLSTTTGVISCLGVLPEQRHQGIGGHLLERCEKYLSQKGATEIFAGTLPFHNPFYMGLYGGSNTPGILRYNQLAEEFLTKRGYEIEDSVIVFQKELNRTESVFDPRFAKFRKEYNLGLTTPKDFGSWWDNCLLAQIDPFEFALLDKITSEKVARAWTWELGEFNTVWHRNAIGIGKIEIVEEKRRQGLAKFLLGQILQQLRAQYFDLVEIQVPGSNIPGMGLCQTLGFEEINKGTVYRRELTSKNS